MGSFQFFFAHSYERNENEMKLSANNNSRNVNESKDFITHHQVIHSKFESKSDKEIWRDFKNGDEDAFNYIYRTNTERLFNYGYQYTKNKELVKDCIQNLYIELRNNRKKLPEVNSISAYLYKAIYWQVKRKVENEKKFISDDGFNESMFGIELSSEEKIIDKEVGKEMREHIENILHHLTQKQRKALLLFYKENFTYSEVAEVMGLKSAKSARKLIYRALFAARKDKGNFKELYSFIGLSILFFETIKSMNS